MAVNGEERGLLLWVGGSFNKNRDRFERRFREVTEAIAAELRGSGQIEKDQQDRSAEQKTLARV